MEQPPPTIFIAPDPPPFPAPPGSVDLAPLEFVLALVAVIAIPALIYSFFCSVNCPPSPFRRRRRGDSDGIGENPISSRSDDDNKETVSDLKYQKETHVKDVGSECPVCLCVFADGEEVKQLGACKHSFHATCIDMWLSSHSNCPVCRASVAPPKHASTNPSTAVSSSSSSNRNNDLQQGLPDAANLV